ncbi:hypothetical protein KUV62_17680 [Salipiger bermudensis]|uniref:hypothetical protein n=1 Tax=Salipiger bermudensis TaxID=344736 RepID=UPI001C98F7FC|nr:hypothetical protein [Salipiger bermudensis]MBY6005756.1 hypothetical protein [Salipiger bermudensis]
MPRLTLPVLVLASAAPAFAAEVADVNSDGVLTLDEVQAVWPDISIDTFLYLDRDGDGLLGTEEIVVARENGLLAEMR